MLGPQAVEQAKHDHKVEHRDEPGQVRPRAAEPRQVAAEGEDHDHGAQRPRPAALREAFRHLIGCALDIVPGRRFVLGDFEPQVIQFRRLLPEHDGLVDRWHFLGHGQALLDSLADPLVDDAGELLDVHPCGGRVRRARGAWRARGSCGRRGAWRASGPCGRRGAWRACGRRGAWRARGRRAAWRASGPCGRRGAWRARGRRGAWCARRGPDPGGRLCGRAHQGRLRTRRPARLEGVIVAVHAKRFTPSVSRDRMTASRCASWIVKVESANGPARDSCGDRGRPELRTRYITVPVTSKIAVVPSANARNRRADLSVAIRATFPLA
jgi:hypothetical protein